MRKRRPRCWSKIAQPDAQGQKLLRDAAETMRLSARGYHRVLRVARTLADLDGAEKIGRLHLAEALVLPCAGRRLCAGAAVSFRATPVSSASTRQVTTFLYTPPTISPGVPRGLSASECVSSCVSRSWPRLFPWRSPPFSPAAICSRRAALHRGGRYVGPDHLAALAGRASCRLHQRSGAGDRAGRRSSTTPRRPTSPSSTTSTMPTPAAARPIRRHNWLRSRQARRRPSP